MANYRRPITCFHCGKKGHIERNCNLKIYQKLSNICPCDKKATHPKDLHVCHICNKLGFDHLLANCPEKCQLCSGYHTTINHLCLLCKKKCNHTYFDCPEKCQCDQKSAHNMKEHECYFCKKIGFDHMSNICPEKCPCYLESQHSKRNHICRFCQEIGFDHYPSDCDNRCMCTQFVFWRNQLLVLFAERKKNPNGYFGENYMPLDIFKYIWSLSKVKVQFTDDHNKKDHKCPYGCSNDKSIHVPKDCKNKCCCKCSKCTNIHSDNTTCRKCDNYLDNNDKCQLCSRFCCKYCDEFAFDGVCLECDMKYHKFKEKYRSENRY